MLIASIKEPTNTNAGDFWYNLANKELYVNGTGVHANSTVWVHVPHGTYDSPIPPIPQAGHAHKFPIWIESGDLNRIPYTWNQNAQGWVSVVPVTYIFPPTLPPVGSIWTDMLSNIPYHFTNNGWMVLSPQSVQNVPYSGGNGALGSSGLAHTHTPVSSPGSGVWGLPVAAPVNINIPAPAIPGSNFTISNPGAQAVNFTVTAVSQTKPLITLAANNSAIRISDIVEILVDGTISYGPNYTPDAAARILWEAIAQMSPQAKENEELQKLRSINKLVLDELAQWHASGFKLPTLKPPANPQAAWEAAMGVII
jgi:hypothetical protein